MTKPKAAARPQPVIPRKIRIGNKMYTIDIVETMMQQADMSRIFYDENRIAIGKKSNVTGKAFKKDALSNSFYHELVHGILYDMGEHHLNANERFVTEFANLLQKAIQSARFE
jgi:hypothetical protein